MLLRDKNYINELKMPDTNSLVIINGVYQSDLSDKNNNVIFDQQTLRISQNNEAEKPIHLLFLNSASCDCAVNIIAEKNSSFILVEEHNNLEQSFTNNVKINFTAKNNSKIIYYKLQTKNQSNTHNAQTNITLEQNSKFISNFFSNGTKISSDILQINLVEENSSYHAFGVISLNDAQALNYKIRIEHLVPNCTSNLLFKGIITDKASGNFDCRVVAHPDAIKTETHVTNKNLLLSESASMSSSPQLEIYADDVICTHGATIGQLDQDALFYLRSRGISENQATQLLTAAFTQEIIDKFAVVCQKRISQDIAYE